MRILVVAGARPNFMKIAPLMRRFRETPGVEALLVHTGQHYDRALSDVFFTELNIPRPDLHLNVGSASHAVQTAEVMTKIEPVILNSRPRAVVVVGDVNSTLAAALTAVKLGVPVAHVEAGLRSFDRAMPEEINRLLTDAISDYCFVTEEDGMENLRREGVPEARIFHVGNVMIDTLMANLPAIDANPILSELGLEPRRYGVATIHRPANVDRRTDLLRILEVLEEIQSACPVVFPVHPRTRARLEEHDLWRRLEEMPNLREIEPVGYHGFIKLVKESRLVLTDSGGVQEETTVLGVPCLTMRENTERPVTVKMGTNRLVGNDPKAILEAFREVFAGAHPAGRVPPLWDGRAAHRIVETLTALLQQEAPESGAEARGLWAWS